jgi:hypothetical protein
MNYPKIYWNLCRINLQNSKGYDLFPLPLAQQWLKSAKIKNSAQINDELLHLFHDEKKPTQERGTVGLCLRCSVSHPILQACQSLANLFSASKNFTYYDLLPFVLNDDGKDLILVDEQGKQFNLNNKNDLTLRSFHVFTVEIIRSYQSQRTTKFSLKNWAFLKTKQNKEIRNFLAEFGFQNLTDWALLNRARKSQIEQLSEQDKILLEVFHQVYRRDRRLQTTQRTKCTTPSTAQLQEMAEKLQAQGIALTEEKQILMGLHRLAQQLRQYDIWQNRESLEHYDSDSGEYQLRRDIAYESLDEDQVEEDEMIQLLHKTLTIALDTSLTSVIENTQKQLAKSKRYQEFAEKFLEGLRLYYVEAQSLKDIAPQLGMTSWDQARRILNPGNILNQVRSQTLEILLEKLLKLAQDKGIVDKKPSPDYLSSLSEQLETFVDKEIFNEAAAEIRSGKNRTFNSPYAQKLKQYLNNH